MIKASNQRKNDTHDHQILHAFYPESDAAEPIDNSITEDQLQMGLVRLFKSRFKTYKNPSTDPRILAIYHELLRETFVQYLDSLRPNGNDTLWTLQEEGKVPLCDRAFLFYMRLIGLTNLLTGDYLLLGMIEKKTVDENIIDPVEEAEPLADYGDQDMIRYRFICICGKHVIRICAKNGKKEHGEDAYARVTRLWEQFVCLEQYGIAIAIFDGASKEAYKFAQQDTETFRAARCAAGPARTLAHLEDTSSSSSPFETNIIVKECLVYIAEYKQTCWCLHATILTRRFCRH